MAGNVAAELEQVNLQNVCKGALEGKFQDRLQALLGEFADWDELAISDGAATARIKMTVEFTVSPDCVLVACSADLVPPKRKAAKGTLYLDRKTRRLNVWTNEGEQSPLFNPAPAAIKVGADGQEED